MRTSIIILCLAAAGALAATPERVAVRHVADLAAKGDPKGLYDLAVLHDMGYDSIPVDSARSTALYRLSAEAGYAPAQNYLGFRYFNGEGVRQDVDSALYWLAKAAGQSDAKAANNLGYLLANSDRVTRDYPQAMKWLGKAADAGVATAESLLADLYRQGLGTHPDTVKAEALYGKAILHGLRDAELKLLAMKGHTWERLPADSLLLLGQYHYTHGAPIIGVTLFENAASPLSPKTAQTSSPTTTQTPSSDTAQTSSPTSAQISSQGTVQTSSEGRENANTEAANEVTKAKALALLGDAYSRGIGVPYDHDRSVEYYLRGALLGDPSAQFVIAELIDIFPDALADLYSTPTESSKPCTPTEQSNPSDQTISSELPRLTPEQQTADYWYEQAARQGITDAETATLRLLN